MRPKKPRELCPGCEAPQAFPLRERKHLDTPEGEVIEVYIACTRCPWHKHIRYSTSIGEAARRTLRRLEAQAKRQTDRHGVVERGLAKRIEGATTIRNAQDHHTTIRLRKYGS